MTSTGRHLDKTQAGIPNAPSERADLYGQSYCERHQGQLPKGRTQRPDIWAHRSRMRSAKEKRALDRGVVPHMGIPGREKSAKVANPRKKTNALALSPALQRQHLCRRPSRQRRGDPLAHLVSSPWAYSRVPE